MPKGIKITGLEEIRRNIDRMTGIIGIEALDAAQEAAAKVIKNAIQAGAPRDSGQLAESVRIFKSKPKGLARQASSAAVRILIGPEKRKGYYGFFLAKGWRTPLGKAMKFATRKGREFTTRRLASGPGSSTARQQGLIESRKIEAPYPEWLSRAGMTVEDQAVIAWLNAYRNKLKQAGMI